MIVNAEGMVAGRLASAVAKKLLSGEEVIGVNAEKAVIAGHPKNTHMDFYEKLSRGDPKKGPFYPRRPDMLLRRIIRGMLPMKKAKGRQAYRKLKVYMGVPEGMNLEGAASPGRHVSSLRTRSITIGELSRKLGWKA